MLRFSVGVTLAAAVAFAFAWPIYFLTPVLTIVFLEQSVPGVSHRGWDLVAYVLTAVFLGMIFTQVLQRYPIVFVPLMGLALFSLFYLVGRQGPIIFSMLCLLSLIILPMVGQVYDPLIPFAAGYFALGAVVAVLAYKLVFPLFPDPPGSPEPPAWTFQPGYSPVAARGALMKTIVLLPVVVIFLAYELKGHLLVLIYTMAIVIDIDTSHAGWHHGVTYMVNTIVGGAAALVVYWMLVAVPEFHFFVILFFTVMWVIAGMIWSDHPLAKNMASAGIAFTILLASSIAPGANFADNFVIRFLMIFLASLYVTGAMLLLERYVFSDNN
ncbi:MAG: DUF2955 domain-containing protein [Arenicellales bacterium]|nr:DUF2955 domain-containing protein [Arenicellales bacterium]